MFSTDYINIQSRGQREVHDLTPAVHEILSSHGVKNGIVTIFAPGSTAAVTTIEYEPGLEKDIDEYLDRLFPYGEHYHHHDTWHDDNGSSHLQAALLGPSLTVPVVGGKLTLGTWQQIVLIDCDTRSRSRKIVVQMMHE